MKRCRQSTSTEKPRRPLSVLLVEGDTERIFYERVKSECFADTPRVHLENLEGLYNVNRKIRDKLFSMPSHEQVRAYCCLDRESRNGEPLGLSLPSVREDLRNGGYRNILSVDRLIATQMIESWFFYDMQGIYKFLRAPVSKRNPRAHSPPERFGKHDLMRLFERHGKVYVAGERARNFINSLDIVLIAKECPALRNGIELVKRQAADTASHIFRV